jgi:hypothetical protein
MDRNVGDGTRRNIFIITLVKLKGSLGNVPQILKKLVIKTPYISDC